MIADVINLRHGESETSRALGYVIFAVGGMNLETSLRFFNTYEPVVPIYRDLIPRLAASGVTSEIVISRSRYRNEDRRFGGTDIRFRSMPALFREVGEHRFSAVGNHISYGLCASTLSTVWRRPKLNVFLTQPPLFFCWGRGLEILRREPYCCIVMDMYPWVAEAAGMLGSNSYVARGLAAVAGAVFRRAKAVIVIGRCMADRMREIGVAPERIHVATNWAHQPCNRSSHGSPNKIRHEWGLDGRFVVMYSGNMGVSHHFLDILEVARRLHRREDIIFLFVGGGTKRDGIVEFTRRHNLHNVEVRPFQPRGRLAESLDVGDLHFVSLKEGFEGLVVPSKAYGILAAGRPLLYQGNACGEIARMVSETGVGEVIDQGDVDGLERAILHASEDGGWRSQAGTRARELAGGRYGVEESVRRYRDVFVSLIGMSRGEPGAP